MKFSLFSARNCAILFSLSGVLSLLNSCAKSGGDNSSYGPFDSNGNYVEEWADNPSKWRRNSSPPPVSTNNDQSMMASNDKPPTNLSPIASQQSKPTIPVVAAQPPRVVASNTAKPSSLPKPRTTSTVVSKPKPKPTVARATVKPKPKPRAVVAKPASSRVTVKKGDTLYGLALRHKTSVAAIQRANGIKGSNLSIGKSLVIPKK